MRASNIGIVAIVSLSLAACTSVRTVNGVEVESARSLCKGPIEPCVLLGLAVVAAAGIGVGLATGLGGKRGRGDRELDAFVAAARALPPTPSTSGGSTTGSTSTSSGSTTAPTTVTTTTGTTATGTATTP